MAKEALTQGVDHVGLTVPDLTASLAFFEDCLGWTKVGGNPAYPAAYVSDGKGVVTLWQAKTETPTSFDRHQNVGLHHLAFTMPSEEALRTCYEKLESWPGVKVEFPVELSGKGPKLHCMIREPGGNRLEFSYRP
ncbi:VOC family protein [Rhodovibrionaceae bacterium A322]